VVEDLAFYDRARDHVVHAVEAADERALAAAGRPDERRHRVPADVERDPAERERPAVPDGQLLDLKDGLSRLDVGRAGRGQLADPPTVDPGRLRALFHDVGGHGVSRIRVSTTLPVSPPSLGRRGPGW
jgi:hypothetical protein